MAEFPQKSSEPVIDPDQIMAEREKTQEEPSPSTQSDPQEEQEITENIE
jgi:hypothetical protein